MTTLAGEAREVALAESQAVLSMARDEAMRERLAELVAEIDEGEVGDGGAELLEQVLELGLQAGRIRAYYGPGGEQAALKTLRRLPRGQARAESAREVSAALASLEGKVLERVSVTAVAPGSYALAINADGLELSVRLDASGARLASVGT
jgi:pyrroloquinoline quinone (PQQ) biosynthesis protein C